MNFLKNGLIGFLLGELITLFVVDSKTNVKFQKGNAWDKTKTLFNDLVQLNVKLVNDVKNHNYKEDTHEAKERFNKELAMIEDKTMALKKYIMENGSDKAKELAAQLHKNYDLVKATVLKTIKKVKKTAKKTLKPVKATIKKTAKKLSSKLVKKPVKKTVKKKSKK